MSENRLRSILGIALVVSQFVVVVWTVYVYVRGGLKFDEMTTAVALLVPMFAVHTTTVVKYFVIHKHRVSSQEEPVTLPFAFLSFFFPVLFVCALLTLVGLKAYGIALASFGEFKTALGLVQTCFAVYIGLFISSLYEGSHEKSN